LDIENNNNTQNHKNIKIMKTTILTIAIAVSTLFGVCQSASAKNAKEEVTTLTEVAPISKIEIHGNVEVYLSNAAADQIKVYNSYYAESALVQDQAGVLRISSYKAEKLIVWVSVSDLRNLDVYDNAEVKSFGKLSAIDLDVNLYNNASAKLNLDSYSAAITLNSHAKADISGEANEAVIKYDFSSTLNTTNFSAKHIARTLKSAPANMGELTEFASL